MRRGEASNQSEQGGRIGRQTYTTSIGAVGTPSFYPHAEISPLDAMSGFYNAASHACRK